MAFQMMITVDHLLAAITKMAHQQGSLPDEPGYYLMYQNRSYHLSSIYRLAATLAGRSTSIDPDPEYLSFWMGAKGFQVYFRAKTMGVRYWLLRTQYHGWDTTWRDFHMHGYFMLPMNKARNLRDGSFRRLLAISTGDRVGLHAHYRKTQQENIILTGTVKEVATAADGVILIQWDIACHRKCIARPLVLPLFDHAVTAVPPEGIRRLIFGRPF